MSTRKNSGQRRSCWIAPLTLCLAAGLASSACAQVDDAVPPQPGQAQPPLAQPEKTSVLQFESIAHDFGRIMDTKDVEHTFRFTNTGGSTVILGEPKGSCGCTIPKLTKYEYAPGEAGEVKVVFKPAGKAGPKNTQTITVSYHDSAAPNEMQPATTLTVNAEVRTAVSVDPKPQVSFGEVVQGQPATQIVTVTGIAPDFEVTYASIARSRLFNVKVLGTEPVEINGEKVRQTKIELALKDTSKRGKMQSIVTFRTNDPQVQLASVQVDAEVVGDIKVLPPRLNIGAVEPKQAFERTIKVMSRGKKPFKIVNIEQSANPPLASPLTFDIKPMDEAEGVGYTVMVKGVGPEALGSLNASLKIKTDVDEPLEVAAVGAVRPPPPMPPTGPMGPTIESPGAGSPTPQLETTLTPSGTQTAPQKRP